MISLRRGDERHHDRRRGQVVWRTFLPQLPQTIGSPPIRGFGILEALNEICLAPGTRVAPRSDGDAEVLTYVREGGLAVDDGNGRQDIIQAGEYRRTMASHSVRTGGVNASPSAWVNFFEIRLRSPECALEASCEQKRFSAADRRGALRVIASPDGRQGSLLVHREVLVFSALLDPGQHVVHALAAGRRAWLHLVHGEGTLDSIAMTTGDGAGVAGERALSFTSRAAVEILLIDIAEAPDVRPSS